MMNNTINGRTPDEIKKGLRICSGKLLDYCDACNYCNWSSDCACNSRMCADALEYIQQLENREWELFDLLSSAWYWKGFYFKQDDGTVYSRASCQYLSFDQAIDEFASALTYAHEVE